jgi:predicted O-methyltransferase YrrM
MIKPLKALAKAVLPRAIQKRLRLSWEAKRFKEFYFGEQLRTIKPLLRQTGETHNFTYDLTAANLLYLAEMIAIATDKSASQIEGYIQEAIDDRELRAYFDSRMAAYDGQKSPTNALSPFGRRLGWYAVVRAMKPRVVVETGVERGHGALLLCAALLRNSENGAGGRYFGTDINPAAGWLLSGKYAAIGKILIGDSLASLRGLNETIDLFINDSDHSPEYEAEEYEAVAPRLSRTAIVLGDNAHVTDKLAVFSRAMGRRFLMFKEQPKNHWYPGGGIGVSFPEERRAL